MKNKIIITKDYKEMSEVVTKLFIKQLLEKPSTVWGLATGSTPVGLYERLGKRKDLDFSKSKSFNLDEYESLKPDDPQSYYYFMQEELFSKINISESNYFLPNGAAEDLVSECKNYDFLIKSNGGIDLQLLGIGTNGHVGFNEPSNKFSDGTHLVDLTDQTIKDNADKYFEGNTNLVPKRALSMGTMQIVKAKKIIILASGKNKAWAVSESIEGTVTPKVPASILQKHDDVTWIIDKAAASKLKNRNKLELTTKVL